jgi:hypothetical protein
LHAASPNSNTGVINTRSFLFIILRYPPLIGNTSLLSRIVRKVWLEITFLFGSEVILLHSLIF